MRDLIIYLIGINVVTFFIYGIDKWKARRGKWRIPEDTLIWLAIAGGSIGALNKGNPTSDDIVEQENLHPGNVGAELEIPYSIVFLLMPGWYRKRGPN